MIAQEVEAEFPELVGRWSAPDHPTRIHRDEHDLPLPQEEGNWVKDYRSLDYNRFSAVLLEAIKEQQVEIEELKAELNTLKVRKP